MIESIKVILVVSVVLAVVMGMERLWHLLVKKVNIHWKVIMNAGIVILFMMAGYLWGLSGFYEWISEVADIPVEK